MTMPAEKVAKHEVKKRAEKRASTVATRRPAQSSTLVAASERNGERKSGSTSRSVTLGKSHLSSYKGSGGRRDTNIRLKAPNIKPPNWLTGGGGKTGTLIVEWLIGVVLIVWSAFDGTKKKGGFQAIAHDFFWRFFGWCFVFFVLALLMRGKNTSKVSVMFGGLLDLVLAITAYSNGSFKALENLFTDTPTAVTPASESSDQSGGTGTGNGSIMDQLKNLLLKPGAGLSDLEHEIKTLENPGGNTPINRALIDVGNFFKHLF